MQLVVGQLWKSLAGGHTGAVEFIIRIVHLVTTENCLQATLIEGFVVGHEGKPLYQRFYLFPHHRENGGLFRVLASEAMHLGTPIIIIVGLWLDQGLKRIHDLTIAHDHHTHGADAGTLVVGRLKIYCCKVSHIQSS